MVCIVHVALAVLFSRSVCHSVGLDLMEFEIDWSTVVARAEHRCNDCDEYTQDFLCPNCVEDRNNRTVIIDGLPYYKV